MNNLLLTTLPQTGAVASWIWGIIGFIIGGIAIAIIIGLLTKSDTSNQKK